MGTITGVVVTVAVLAVATLAGLLLRGRDGAIESSPGGRGSLPEPLAGAVHPPGQHGEAVLLLQVSSRFCSPCRAAHGRLAALAEQHTELRHTEVDITDQPEIAAALEVRGTPTTIAYDVAGVELLRVHGVPDSARLREALAPHLGQ